MGPIGHSAISACIGVGVWAVTGSPAAGGAALGVGVLTDVDHLFDLYRWYIRGKKYKTYLWFHAWEYSITGLLLVGLFYYHPLLLAVVLAHLGHVAADHFHNRRPLWTYFITYRALVRFDTARIAPKHDALHPPRPWLEAVPFGKRIEPWYQRNIEPWLRSRISD